MTIGELEQLAGVTDRTALWMRFVSDPSVRRDEIPHLSAQGVRKGLAELLAELGCSQYDIMAILGHSEAKTSEVYTRRVERWKLALWAMERVKVSQTWF